MPAFRYTVINQQNQQLSGVLNAATPDDARKELNTLGFAVVTMEDVSTIKVPTPIDQPIANTEAQSVQISLKFAFVGKDKTNRRIRGTIAAQDIKLAYKRLVEEYNFLVEALTPAAAQISELEATQILRKVKNEYEKQKLLEENSQTGVLTADEQEEKEALLENVDFILKKIDEIITTFGEEIKPEMKKAIRDDVDRLLRIKSSNNLTSIKQTCKELLQRIQDRETFLHQETRVKEKTQLQLETETMMRNLGKRRKTVEIDTESKEENRFTLFLEKLFPKDLPEVIERKERIKAINEQLKTYVKLWMGADKNYRQEIKIGIKTLWEERKRLTHEISEKNKEMRAATQAKNTAMPTKIEHLYKEFYTFSIWLLFGYLTYYFVMTILITKALPIELPSFLTLNIYKTKGFFPLLISIFIIHTGLSLQQLFYPKAILAKILTVPVTLFCAFFILINFF